MKRVDVVLRLGRVGIVFGIDIQHLAAFCEDDKGKYENCAICVSQTFSRQKREAEERTAHPRAYYSA